MTKTLVVPFTGAKQHVETNKFPNEPLFINKVLSLGEQKTESATNKHTLSVRAHDYKRYPKKV